MDVFYLIVLSILAILLIIALTYIGITMTSTSNPTTIFPPNYSECPDYWTMSSDLSACMIPKQNSGVSNLGNIYDSAGNNMLTSANTFGLASDKSKINFSDKGWNLGGVSAVCGQKNWARANGIVWDGISNFNGC
jgi:hypothetical protein